MDFNRRTFKIAIPIDIGVEGDWRSGSSVLSQERGQDRQPCKLIRIAHNIDIAHSAIRKVEEKNAVQTSVQI